MPQINRIEATYRALVAEGRQILRLFSGNPNDEGFLFPSGILKEAYGRYFDAQEYRPHPKGLLRAREAISSYYGRQGGRVDPDQILLTSGTSESFLHLFSLLARPGENILAPNPAYPLFDSIAGLAGVELRPYRLDEEKDWAIDLEDLRRRTDSGTRAIVLISPNNPTGAVATAGEIAAVTEWANAGGIPLICDEVFSEFYYGAGVFPRPMTAGAPDLCFTLNGISKMFALPALKLGWIAVTGGDRGRLEAAVDRLETTADTFLSCHTPIQMVLPDLFDRGEEFVRSYRGEVGRRRDLAIDLLKDCPGIRFVEPRGGFYLTAGIRTGLSEEEFVIRLMEESGVFVHPGYFFDYEKGTHIVISFLTHPERLKRGIEAIWRRLKTH